MPPIATDYWPGQTHFGYGAVQRVGDEAERGVTAVRLLMIDVTLPLRLRDVG